MKNFIQPGASIGFIAPSGGVVGGDAHLLGAIVGVVRHSASEGAESILDLEGVFSLPKAATVTPAPGALLYFVAADKTITNSASGNTKIGVHAGLVASGASDAKVAVRLNGAI